MSGSIIRVSRRDKAFFTTINEPFNDPNLSFGARGILAYLLSKPDHWEVRNDDLYRQSSAGRTAIDGMLKELKQHGYLRRFRQNDQQGHLVWVTEIYESATLNPDYQPADDVSNAATPNVQNPTIGHPDLRIPNVQKPTVGQPNDGKPDDIVITEQEKTEKRKDIKAIATILSFYHTNIGSLTPTEVDEVRDLHTRIAACFKAKPAAEETAIDWFQYAICEAVRRNVPRWCYVKAILNRLLQSGSLAEHRSDGAKINLALRSDTQPQVASAAPLSLLADSVGDLPNGPSQPVRCPEPVIARPREVDALSGELMLADLPISVSTHVQNPSPQATHVLLEAEQCWIAICQRLKLRLPPSVFDRHFRPVKVLSLDNGVLCVAVANAISLDWIQHRLNRIVSEAAAEVQIRFGVLADFSPGQSVANFGSIVEIDGQSDDALPGSSRPSGGKPAAVLPTWHHQPVVISAFAPEVTGIAN